MTWATAGFIIAFLFSDVTQGWISNYHRPLTSNACGGEHLNRLESQHPNKCEDCVRNLNAKLIPFLKRVTGRIEIRSIISP